MSDMILHHYPTSPFSEKVRVAFGIKGLAWKSVIIPRILPKPDLMPLTGGYRKTAVLQIGADIYCDTQLILRETERRAPEPTLYPSQTRGLADALGWWAERSLFSTAVAVLFAKVGSALPQAFIEDRSKFSGREFNPQAMKAAEPRMMDAFRAQLHWLETIFSDGKPFLFGPQPSAADCSLYHMVWFVRSGRPEALAEFSRHPRLGRPTGIHRSWRAHHDRRAGSARNRQGGRTHNPSIDRFTGPQRATVGRAGQRRTRRYRKRPGLGRISCIVDR